MNDRPARYPHLMSLLFERPWAVTEGVMAVMQEVMQLRLQGVRFTPEEIGFRVETMAAQPRGARAGRKTGAVAVIPVYGVLTQRAELTAESSGGTSVEGVAREFRDAMANEDVGAIVFDIDSPGGSVDGIPEFAAEVRAARGEKPIVAIANAMMASAAYWIGSAADSISVSPSGAAGNIGVLAMHQDKSEAYAAEGVKTTMVKAGKFKGEGNEFEPLSPEALAAVQTDVDYYYGMFTADVAAGRSRPDQRVTSSDVAGGYGEGRLLVAKKAVAANVADRIETLDQLVSRLVKAGPGAVRAGAFDDRDSIRAGDVPGVGYSTLGGRLELVSGEMAAVVTRLRERSEARSQEGGRGLSETTRLEMRKALGLRAELDAIESVLEADEHPPEDPPATDDAPATARSVDLRQMDLVLAERTRT